MNRDLTEMARSSYGYGRWAAPYWFIGPEQGQALEEGDLERRTEAWCYFGKRELDDCREFHLRICETRWHKDKPPLQSTWRPLMILLGTFLARPTDRESLRNYQRDKWGSSGGETCVIELSGLAAHDLNVDRDRSSFRGERIRALQEKVQNYRPELVVMYGIYDKDVWQSISKCKFEDKNVLKRDSTIFALAKHPVSRGLSNAYWECLGKEARQLACGSATG